MRWSSSVSKRYRASRSSRCNKCPLLGTGQWLNGFYGVLRIARKQHKGLRGNVRWFLYSSTTGRFHGMGVSVATMKSGMINFDRRHRGMVKARYHLLSLQSLQTRRVLDTTAPLPQNAHWGWSTKCSPPQQRWKRWKSQAICLLFPVFNCVLQSRRKSTLSCSPFAVDRFFLSSLRDKSGNVS